MIEETFSSVLETRTYGRVGGSEVSTCTSRKGVSSEGSREASKFKYKMRE